MNYIRETIEYLQSYNDLKESIQNMTDEIIELKTKLESEKSLEISDMPHGSGTTDPDDRMVNNIFKRQQLEESKTQTIKKIKQMDAIINSLPEDEAKVLKMWFIECKSRDNIAKVMKYSEAHIYRIKNRGVRKLGVKLFGINAIN